MRKRIFPRKEVQAWDGLSRQAEEAPSLEDVELWLNLSQPWPRAHAEQDKERALTANNPVIRETGREQLYLQKTFILILAIGQNQLREGNPEESIS